MAKVTYIGVAEKTSTQGHQFINGEAVEITDASVLERLKNNRFFEVIEVPKKSPKTSKKAQEKSQEKPNEG